MYVEEKQRSRILVGSICAYNLSLFGWWAQPEILHTLIERSGFSPSASGLVLSVELIAMALTAFVLAPFVGRLPLKTGCYVAGLIVTACQVASAAAGSVELLVVLRALAGCAAGLVLAVANAVLASSPDPDRAYGLLATWNVVSGVALLTAMPPLEHAYGQAGVFGLIGLACLLMCLFMKDLPATLTIERAPKVSRNRFAVAALLLTAIFAWGTATAMSWPFTIHIGQKTALDATIVGLVAALAAVGGLVGGATATRIGGRYGRHKPFMYGMLIHVAAMFALTHVFVGVVFVIAAPAVIACVYFLLPYYLAVSADYDPGGGLPAAMAGMFVLTGGSGPLLGGILVDQGGVQTIAYALLGSCLFAGFALRWILADQNQTQP